MVTTAWQASRFDFLFDIQAIRVKQGNISSFFSHYLRSYWVSIIASLKPIRFPVEKYLRFDPAIEYLVQADSKANKGISPCWEDKIKAAGGYLCLSSELFLPMKYFFKNPGCEERMHVHCSTRIAFQCLPAFLFPTDRFMASAAVMPPGAHFCAAEVFG